jgi:hypothetical protein
MSVRAVLFPARSGSFCSCQTHHCYAHIDQARFPKGLPQGAPFERGPLPQALAGSPHAPLAPHSLSYDSPNMKYEHQSCKELKRGCFKCRSGRAGARERDVSSKCSPSPGTPPSLMVHALATRISFDPLCKVWPVDSNPPDPVQTPSGRSCPMSGRRPSACPTVREDVHPSSPWARPLHGGHCPVARVHNGTQLGNCRTGGHRPDQTGKNHARGEERSPLLCGVCLSVCTHSPLFWIRELRAALNLSHTSPNA